MSHPPAMALGKGWGLTRLRNALQQIISQEHLHLLMFVFSPLQNETMHFSNILAVEIIFSSFWKTFILKSILFQIWFRILYHFVSWFL